MDRQYLPFIQDIAHCQKYENAPIVFSRNIYKHRFVFLSLAYCSNAESIISSFSDEQFEAVLDFVKSFRHFYLFSQTHFDASENCKNMLLSINKLSIPCRVMKRSILKANFKDLTTMCHFLYPKLFHNSVCECPSRQGPRKTHLPILRQHRGRVDCKKTLASAVISPMTKRMVRQRVFIQALAFCKSSIPSVLVNIANSDQIGAVLDLIKCSLYLDLSVEQQKRQMFV